MANKVINTILSRTSCRAYSDKPVPLSKIKSIVEAGKFAPSGMNRQICNIVVVRKKSLLNEIKETAIKMFNREPTYDAPILIIVYGPKDDPFTYLDGSCIIENMLIAATSLNLGSCWIHAIKDLVPSNAKLAKKLGIDDSHQVVGSVAVGYRQNDEIKVKPRKDDFVKII